ncbi:MAG: hypothetical protein EBS88_11635 [Betaproteobacteria bacterium]|nr:hypothetical protein [Betaproteobacteria bacterium]
MLDCLIKNGTVVDGTGQKPFIADVGIQGGRITHIGQVNEAAKETMDASGLWITHLTASTFWCKCRTTRCACTS